MPNLIIIGAIKSGTTSLHHYLSLHPEVAMSTPKELHFFSLDRNWKRGLAWYEGHFKREAKIRGESSPSYTRYPLLTQTPERMYSVIPQAKLIYILRDPVTRLVSEYRQRLADGTDLRPLPEILEDLKENQYVYNSKYYTQIQQYLGYYPEENIFITTIEELNKYPKPTMQKIFRFLEISPAFDHPDFSRKLHKSDDKRLKNPVGLFLTRKFRNSELKNRIRAALPSVINEMYVSMSRSNIKVAAPILSDELKQRLITELKADTDRLRSFTGTNFDSWCL